MILVGWGGCGRQNRHVVLWAEICFPHGHVLIAVLGLFLPQNVSVWESQFGHRSLKFSKRWSFLTPLMWSSLRTRGLPRQ